MYSHRLAAVNDGCLSCLGGSPGQTTSPAGRNVGDGGLGLSLLRRNNLTGNRAPEDEPSRRDVDLLIASELNRLSFEEREKALNDVHGVPDPSEEKPEVIESCLSEMQMRLTIIKGNTMYEVAERMSPEYVMDTDFRLLFLRSAMYNPVSAADKMIQFFEIKQQLFGNDKLCQDISLDDFDDDDMEALRYGYGQISPLRDMSGRPIVVFLQSLRRFKVIENAMRVSYYVIMSAMKSMAAQHLGVVVIYYSVDSFRNDVSAVTKTAAVRNSLPLKVASNHFCYNDPKMFFYASLPIRSTDTHTKIRYRPHFGSHQECIYALTSYGIPVNALPIKPNGELMTNNHLSWIEAQREHHQLRKQRDQQGLHERRPDALAAISSMPCGLHSMGSLDQTSATATTGLSASTSSLGEKTTITTAANEQPDYNMTPRYNDVLFGRGKNVVDAPGNINFRRIVDYYEDRYEAAGRLEKTCIAELIVRMVKETNGGRFLKREDGQEFWSEVDDAVARQKVAHAFRNRRKQPIPLSSLR